ncbi:HU family DNA-binding protein [uncultured Bacteroides sp.]|uniref:HU family DNA-binding protein n=1 Tax=uncultured Bacteroides sp. TaxID=162156 RepID=UPI002AAAB665|nr:HU family DNA-binding protein [uncultured Bacteroides sp.]
MSDIVNKNSFARELAKRLNCTNSLAKTFIKEYNDLIADKIQEGCAVKIQYFGVFSPYMRPERIGRNPQTGDRCKISTKTTMKFRSSKYFLEKINNKK